MLVYLVTVVCMTGDPTCGAPPVPYDCLVAEEQVIGCGPARDGDGIDAIPAPRALELDAAILYEEPILDLLESRTIVIAGRGCALVETTLTCTRWIR